MRLIPHLEDYNKKAKLTRFLFREPDTAESWETTAMKKVTFTFNSKNMFESFYHQLQLNPDASEL